MDFGRRFLAKDTKEKDKEKEKEKEKEKSAKEQAKRERKEEKEREKLEKKREKEKEKENGRAKLGGDVDMSKVDWKGAKNNLKNRRSNSFSVNTEPKKPNSPSKLRNTFGRNSVSLLDLHESKGKKDGKVFIDSRNTKQKQKVFASFSLSFILNCVLNFCWRS